LIFSHRDVNGFWHHVVWHMINSFWGNILLTTLGYPDHILLNSEQPFLVMHFDLLLLVLVWIPSLFFLICFVT
jgi:uncharacterized membrane protein YqaE (UPF0057 family)